MTAVSTRKDAVTFAAEVSDGYMAVHIDYGDPQPSHPSGYFSVTADIYTSRGAFELGADNAIHSGGCLHEQILETFPQLAPVVALHLADVETGEPMHAEANARYSYVGSHGITAGYKGARTSDIYPRQLEEYGLPDTEEGRRKYLYQQACRILRVDSIDVGYPGDGFEQAFRQFVDAQRDRWAREAAEARALIESLATESVDVPADHPTGERWAHLFDGGLQVSARCQEPHRFDDIGGHYHYLVKVTASGASHTAHYYGSAADYNAGNVDARQAALGVLQELASYQHESAEDMFDEFGLDPDEDRATLRAMRRQEAAYDRMSGAIDANAHLFS